jgi:hypothetical protein
MAVETVALKSFCGDSCLRCHGAEKQERDIRCHDLSGDFVAEGAI